MHHQRTATAGQRLDKVTVKQSNKKQLINIDLNSTNATGFKKK